MTTPLRATAYLPPGHDRPVWDIVTLAHDERRLRRKLLVTVHGEEVMVDLARPTTLEQHGGLILEDGRAVEVIAAEERLYEIRARDAVHLMQLAWHIGNRHAKAQIEPEWEGIGLRIVIQRDHVLRDMLIGLGATVTEISEPFSPLEGAYAGHSHGGESHVLLRK